MLKTKAELALNSIWRSLHLRDYIDETHNLTSWGKVLNAAFSSLPPKSDLEEAIFLAIELLRFGLLNSQAMFPTYSGGPMHGSGLFLGYLSFMRVPLTRSRNGPGKHTSPLAYRMSCEAPTPVHWLHRSP